MTRRSGGAARWRRAPLIGLALREREVWRAERASHRFGVSERAYGSDGLPYYPLEMAALLGLPFGALDAEGIPYNAPDATYPATYHPTTIAQYALACWNAYLDTGAEARREAFLRQARWLLAHEEPVGGDAGGWPIPFPSREFYTPGPWLSALTQGNVISTLTRAYRLTNDEAYMRAARRAVRTFERDIVDGGVSAAVGEDGVFFEEVAVYPAAHILNGYILALFGLYDYVALTGDGEITELIERSRATLHTLLDGYDAGYWTRYDLLHRRLVPLFYHALHVSLMKALARVSGCAHCAALAARWDACLQSRRGRARYFVASRAERYGRALARRARGALLRGGNGASGGSGARADGGARVIAPITAFPIAGGMRGVLAGVALAMAGEWRLTYLTRTVGAGGDGDGGEGAAIRAFGGRGATPWQFPNVWLYALAGWRALVALLRSADGQASAGAATLILPQDGVYTGAFAGVAAALLGARVTIMDHGSVTLPYSARYRAELERSLARRAWPARLVARVRLALYWPSLRALTRIATRCADQLLVAGDEVEEVYRERLGVHPSRIVRYPYMVDSARFAPLGERAWRAARVGRGLAPDALVMTLINRLAPEKGLDVALRGIQQALEGLSPERRARTRVLLAGAGPLRAEVEAEAARLGLLERLTLLGEVSAKGARDLLQVSDIFVYAGTRGTNYSMAVLEAMATGCAVIATTEPRSNARLLAEGRGVAIAAGDAEALAQALTHALCDDGERAAMGSRARRYVEMWHSAEALRRCLLRATAYAPEHQARMYTYNAPETMGDEDVALAAEHGRRRVAPVTQ